MSNNRASVIELENEFNRAMALLTDDPLPSDDVEQILVEIESESESAYALIGSGDGIANPDHVVANHLVRIAAIALEGAARLRRTK